MDEADRMLDKGFYNDIVKIIKYCNQDRYTYMFSATWPDSINKLSKEFIKDPVHISFGSNELNANTNVKQKVEVIEQKDKNYKLLNLLKK